MPPAFSGSEHTHSTLSQRGYEVVAFDDKETNPPLGFILRHLLASKLTKTGRIQPLLRSEREDARCYSLASLRPC